jgi:peptidyl-tRNA hydrolase, PTH1 family
MGLFVKRSGVGGSGPMYSISKTKTMLIVGLGNPGEKYEKTRHNIGFVIIEELAKSLSSDGWKTKKDLLCELTVANAEKTKIILIKPNNFMNNSGITVSKVVHYFGLQPTDITVVYDDIDIEFGSIRMRAGGSSGGHNGVKSVIEHIGEDFNRVRIGVANEVSPKSDSAKFVLSKFSKTEQEHLPNLKKEAVAALEESIHTGLINNDTRKFIL